MSKQANYWIHITTERPGEHSLVSVARGIKELVYDKIPYVMAKFKVTEEQIKVKTEWLD